MEQEQRRHHRLRVNMIDIEVDISDRVGFSTGTLKDISRFGICISDIPRKLQTKNKSLTVVVYHKGERHKLQLQPKWQRPDGVTMTTGALIDNAPWSWTAMVMQMKS